MAYTKQTWLDGKSGATPISAERLGHIEAGIAAAQDAADAAAAASVSIARLPTGTKVSIDKDPVTGWPNRPTTRTDIKVEWCGPDPSPPVVQPPAVNGQYERDQRFVYDFPA